MYAHPEVLVNTSWVEENIDNKKVRILEVDYDPENAYEEGHIKNAALIWWRKDINDQLRRDILTKEEFEKLMSKFGVKRDTTIILYGDFNNWFAAFAFWVLKYYGHEDVRIMNGGRKRWEMDKKSYTKDIPTFEPTNYKVSAIHEEYRAYYEEVKRIVDTNSKDYVLIDVRSPKEYSGEITAPPEYPMEHAQRGGHIPKAKNIPWAQAVNDDGTFKPIEELKRIYESQGIMKDKKVIAYCRIGERSSHTWFVLKYLLGYENVKNYDGSWTEWGNMIRNPIEK